MQQLDAQLCIRRSSVIWWCVFWYHEISDLREVWVQSSDSGPYCPWCIMKIPPWVTKMMLFSIVRQIFQIFLHFKISMYISETSNQANWHILLFWYLNEKKHYRNTWKVLPLCKVAFKRPPLWPQAVCIRSASLVSQVADLLYKADRAIYGVKWTIFFCLFVLFSQAGEEKQKRNQMWQHCHRC